MKLQINMPFSLIQQIRLVHALTESDFDIAIPAGEETKFSVLKEKFGSKFASYDSDSFDITGYLNISHKDPLTSIGGISRPLIFPHVITSYCRSLWADTRKFRYSFQGLVTAQRRSIIEYWVAQNFTAERSDMLDPESTVYRLRDKLAPRDDTGENTAGDLLLSASVRGRRFPIKAWDETYFRHLSDSQFVLCPCGDYIWSYRFYEAILCGAIPIVEKSCSSYDGFRFFSFEDSASQLNWSREDAEYNYNICIEKITVPIATLNNEITKIVEARG